MMRWLVVAVLSLAPGLAFAQDEGGRVIPQGMIPPDQRLVREVVFDANLQKIRLMVDKRLAREPKLPADEAKYLKYYDEAGVYMAYPLDVKLSTADDRWFVLRCDSGGSDDPQCVLSTSQDPEQPGAAIPGTFFVVPGDGCVYSAGHSNTMFSVRALHCLKEGTLQPVPQPFQYAGLKSKALKKLVLYANKAKSTIVTTVQPGEFVEVVLQDSDLFLLRDAFGLTGWASLEMSQEATEIAGFFYHGD